MEREGLLAARVRRLPLQAELAHQVQRVERRPHFSDPGDGQFDVVLITEAERDRLLYYLEHWQDNRDRLAILPTLRGRRLQIEWTGFALHIDDKLQPKPKAKPKEMAGSSCCPPRKPSGSLAQK